MDDIPHISSERRQQVFNQIRTDESSYADLAEHLGVSQSTVRDHVADLKTVDGISIGERLENGTKMFYWRADAKEHPVNETTSQAAGTGQSKRQVTNGLNDAMAKMEDRLLRLLDSSQPAVADGGLVQNDSHEDVVVHATDDHVGDVTTDEFGNVTYNESIWRERRTETFDSAFRIVNRQQKAGWKFDTFHLLLGGDMVTGEGIYEGQAHNLEMTLDEQVEAVTTFYMEQIRRAAALFPTVQVVCQSGNHGELRASGSSKSANADRLVYLTLDAMVRESELENVTFIRNDSTHFTNFEMRGHRGHLRHGDDSLEHIGTSSGKKRWFNWRDKHQFSIAYRGHFHQFQYDTITRTREVFIYDDDGNIVTDEEGDPKTKLVTDNVPVIMSGSPKPPEEFEESLAVWSQPAATIHGVSDDRAVTWFYPLDFE